MSDRPTIRCSRNGPLLLKGETRLFEVRGEKAHEVEGSTALCRCGGSANKPFCDGTHARTGFQDEKDPDRVPDRREDHRGKEITVHDNRGICAHAGYCTDGAPDVFRLREEPFVDPDGAPRDEIVATIGRCPSGALSYSIDGVEHRDRDEETRILIAPNGPYAIQGGVDLEGVEWGKGASREHYALCRCGMSRNKPFCSGAHWDVPFDPE